MRGKNKKIDRNVIFLSLIFIILVFTIIFIYRQFRSDELMIKLEKNEFITVSFNVGKGNTLFFSELLIFSPQTYKAAIFNIPANYRTVFESISKIDRLDVLFDFKKPEKMISRIESITSLPIDFYINIDPDNLVKVVDLLSGLELFIANPFETINDNEVILLPSGSNVLDGEKTLIYLTADSSNENDADLIGRWHKFLQAFIKKTADQSIYLGNNDILKKFYSFFTTDMNIDSFRSYISTIGKINIERMILQRILGDRKQIDDQILLFPYYDGNLLKETIKQTLISIKNEDIISDEEINIKIEILNGTNIPGLAARTAHFFTNLGFDVVSTKNAEKNDYEKTVVVSRGSNPASANKIAGVIRCTNIESNMEKPSIAISGEENTISGVTRQVEVTVILGKDFDGRYCK